MKITKLTAALLVALVFAFGAQAATYQPGTYTAEKSERPQCSIYRKGYCQQKQN